MCGIAGILDPKKRSEVSLWQRVSQLLEHRGPDDEGIFSEGPVSLLHRRLSIIDLSGGTQPMVNEDKNLVIVFNGEIYNFIQLKDLLEAKGHIFSTKSDTEVILHGYEEWGEKCLEKLSGMFAFAIYNRNEQSIFLARDRCGEKPIYYSFENGRFVFASEVQAVLKMMGRAPHPDPNSIYLFLRLGYIPAPYSYYKSIKKIPAGYSMTLKQGKLKLDRYYQPTLKEIREKKNEHDLCDELDHTLSCAVKKMLVSDVPLGAFLSGGIDSSLIVAMMAKHGNTPETYSISFNNESYDESSYAEYVSRVIGTNHTQFRVGFENFESSIAIMDNFGEPFSDSSSIPTFYLTKKTREKITVALSGDGGDELFGGYRRYLGQHLAGYYKLIPELIRKRLIENGLSRLPDRDVYYADSFINTARIFTGRVRDASDNLDLMLNTLFSHKQIISLFPDLPDGRHLIQKIIGGDLSCHPVEQLMIADRNLYLPDDILVKVDRMSMQNSLEVRAPFLDPEVLRFSEKIPLSMKIRGVNQKHILKKVAQRYLPQTIVNRKKHGFMVPLMPILKRIGKDSIRSKIPVQAVSEKIKDLLDIHFDRNIDMSHKLFALMILGRYLNDI